MIEIDPQQIDLWLVFSGEISDPVLLREYSALLCEGERLQRSRFHFARDQHRYLVTRAVVRSVLSKYVAIAPAAWTFRPDAFGRPAIANENVAARRLAFNVAHAGNLIVLGVARECALGVDTEDVCARDPPLEIAERYFAADEAAALRALPREQQRQRFFEYWTLKESYIKAHGKGLSMPLDRFSFHFTANAHLRLELAAGEPESTEHWRFWQLQPTPEYLISVCAGRVGSPLSRLATRRIVPLHEEEAVDCPLLRTSAETRRN